MYLTFKFQSAPKNSSHSQRKRNTPKPSSPSRLLLTQSNWQSIRIAMASKLIILYGIGGLSDVGRHAILAALEHKSVQHITVITEYPEKLNEKNWECNCSPKDGHTNPFNDAENASRLKMVKIDTWKNEQVDLSTHFEGADAVISCLGHRQPGWKYPELKQRGLIAYDGNRQVIKAMKEANVKRVVVISSFGLRTDDGVLWPHWARRLMGCLFNTFQRRARNDLEVSIVRRLQCNMNHVYIGFIHTVRSLLISSQKMDKLYQSSDGDLDYLIVRPVGIGEEREPVGEYYIQEANGEAVGGNMAKLDVARFMLDQAVGPSLHRTSKVVGAKPGTPM